MKFSRASGALRTHIVRFAPGAGLLVLLAALAGGCTEPSVAQPIADAGYRDPVDSGAAAPDVEEPLPDASVSPNCSLDYLRSEERYIGAMDLRFPNDRWSDGWTRLVFDGWIPGERLAFIAEEGGWDAGFIGIQAPRLLDGAWSMPEPGEVVAAWWVGTAYGSWVHIETLDGELVLEVGSLAAFLWDEHGVDPLLEIDESPQWACDSDVTFPTHTCPYIYTAMGLKLSSGQGPVVPEGGQSRVAIAGHEYLLFAARVGHYDVRNAGCSDEFRDPGSGFLGRLEPR